MAARDITGVTQTAFDGEGLGVWGWWALQGEGLAGGGRAEKTVALLLLKQGQGALGGLERPPFLEFSSLYLALLFTLMVFV